jgi:hypothetical protein
VARTSIDCKVRGRRFDPSSDGGAGAELGGAGGGADRSLKGAKLDGVVPGSGFGTDNNCLQPGQRTAFPAAASGTRNFFRQLEHSTMMDTTRSAFASKMMG